MLKKSVLVLFVVGGVAGFLALLEIWRQAENEVAAPNENAGMSLATHSAISQETKGGDEPLRPSNAAFPKQTVDQSRSAGDEPIDELLAIIPAWLRESGEVHRERIEVGGQWVDRARSRYEWADGELVEVEVSDLGGAATEEQFKSLGFDVDLESEDGKVMRLMEDGENYVANMEFSEEDLEGNIQIIVGGRFLMEVQMEGLPFEAFQALEDRDAVFGALQKRVKADN